jgi:hypothetical protein
MALIVVTSACPALAIEQARLRYPVASIYDYDKLMHGLNSRARTKVKRKIATQIKQELVVGSHEVVLVLRSDITPEHVLGEPVSAVETIHIRKQRTDKGTKKSEDISGAGI